MNKDLTLVIFVFFSPLPLRFYYYIAYAKKERRSECPFGIQSALFHYYTDLSFSILMPFSSSTTEIMLSPD